MTYLNVEARLDGKLIPTKKRLKEAVRNGEDVEYASTSPHVQYKGPIDDLKPNEILSVCGPDPYRNRRWFAMVNRNGKVS